MSIIRKGFDVKPEKLSCLDLEIALIEHFNPRQNIIVPNVSWGMFDHECDLLIITKAGCSYEIEIKVSKHDLIKDKEKRHTHSSNKINRLYFAMPSSLLPYIEHVPEKAGVIEVRDGKCFFIRDAKINNDHRFNEKEKFQATRLGTMRIGSLKRRIRNLIALSKGIVKS